MLTYIFKRLVLMVPVLLAISFLVFNIVELPPGSFLSNKCAEARKSGEPLPPGC